MQAGLIDQIATAVAAVNVEQLCTEFNAAAERLFGWSRDELLGRDLSDLLVAPGAEVDLSPSCASGGVDRLGGRRAPAAPRRHRVPGAMSASSRSATPRASRSGSSGSSAT